MSDPSIFPAKNKTPPPLALNGPLSAYDLMSLHWMARRYADGRSSYSPGLFNDIARKLLAAGVELKKPHFARDGMGRRFDGLTDEQVSDAEADMPRGFSPEADERLRDAIDALRQCVGVLEMMRDDVVEPYWNARHKALTHAHAFLGDGPSTASNALNSEEA